MVEGRNKHWMEENLSTKVTVSKWLNNLSYATLSSPFLNSGQSEMKFCRDLTALVAASLTHCCLSLSFSNPLPSTTHVILSLRLSHLPHPFPLFLPSFCSTDADVASESFSSPKTPTGLDNFFSRLNDCIIQHLLNRTWSLLPSSSSLVFFNSSHANTFCSWGWVEKLVMQRVRVVHDLSKDVPWLFRSLSSWKFHVCRSFHFSFFIHF